MEVSKLLNVLVKLTTIKYIHYDPNNFTNKIIGFFCANYKGNMIFVAIQE